ncbi:MAG: hypothetical protein IT384_31020 [Deltaproteobacteria bacterium]|nr:hypothetical protein [Deltaproteobacteria bacterium]
MTSSNYYHLRIPTPNGRYPFENVPVEIAGTGSHSADGISAIVAALDRRPDGLLTREELVAATSAQLMALRSTVQAGLRNAQASSEADHRARPKHVILSLAPTLLGWLAGGPGGALFGTALGAGIYKLLDQYVDSGERRVRELAEADAYLAGMLGRARSSSAPLE